MVAAPEEAGSGGTRGSTGWVGAPAASVLNCGGSGSVSGGSVERRCLPLWLPHFFLSGAGVCWAGRGVGTPGPGCPSPLGPPDPFLAPATPGHTRRVLPHLGHRSLTFSMTPTTLQPLSCSRAELSVRMGRSLRLLKPCNGRREPHGGLRVTASSPCGGHTSACQETSGHRGQDQGTGRPPHHRHRPSGEAGLGPGWPGYPLSSAPTQPSFQAQGVLRNPSQKHQPQEADAPRGGEITRATGLKDQGRPRYLHWEKHLTRCIRPRRSVNVHT